MKKVYKLKMLVVLLINSTLVAQQTPANTQITFVGTANNINIGSFSKVVDATGKHIYPGFIATNASLGLAEVDAVKASRDFDEVGTFIPHIRSIIAYNAESKVVESMRPNGVLMAQIAPRGGTISGTSSVVQLDAWNWEDAAIKIDDGIHINWPGLFQRGRWWLGEDPALKPSKSYNKRVGEIAAFFTNAKAYIKGGQQERNLEFEAVEGLYTGKQKLYIHASREKAIVDAINWAVAEGIKNLVLVHADDALKTADLLKKHNVAVLVPRPHRLPDAQDDDVLGPFKLAKQLTDKGILVAIEMEGQMERMNTRNLPFYAGTYAAHGLDKEKAVQLITLNAAKILGVDNLVGSLETGKDATLFISKGDALDMRTNIIEHAFIQGRTISLETHQTKLYKRYMDKYNSK